MTIGEVSRLLGLPASTIRYYEKQGLIRPPRRHRGRREFDARALLDLRLAVLARSVGFSVAETRRLRRRLEGNRQPSTGWSRLAREKRTLVRGQIRDLLAQDRALGALIDCRCATLSDCVDALDEGVSARRWGEAGS